MLILIATDYSLSEDSYIPNLLRQVGYHLKSNSHVIQTIERDLFSEDQVRHNSHTGQVKIKNPLPEIKSIVDKFEPEVAYISSKGSIAKQTAKYCRKKGIPFITSHWGNDFSRSRLRIHKHANFVLTPSVWQMTRLSRTGINQVVKWGRAVDDTFLNTTPQPEKRRAFITWVGQVEEYTGVREFIRTLIPNSHKIVCGKGSLFGSLQSKFRHIDFVDYNNDNDFLETLKLSDVCISDGRTLHDEMNILKANACGIPVVAKPYIRSSEIINSGVNGLIDILLQRGVNRSLEIEPQYVAKTATMLSYAEVADDLVYLCGATKKK
jgi:glycosyltransferase involved in cell wall biosynthesis